PVPQLSYPPMIHTLPLTSTTLHGHFSSALPPILTVDSGDTIRCQTIDAGWNVRDQPQPLVQRVKFTPHDRERDPGHALIGPIAIRGAEPGMTLEVRLNTIRPGPWGWTSAGGFPSFVNQALGLDTGDEIYLSWKIAEKTATNQFGQTISIRPFLGILGMPPPDTSQRHSTVPPRPWGGNIDCKELIGGSRVFLPIPVSGGLFSLGDGHAVQGDGEVANPALECPMDEVEVELHLHPELHLSMPRAETPAGRITFGFDEDLNAALVQALSGMLDWMQELYGVERNHALALATTVVDLHVTQVANGVKGVHAILPDGAVRQ
ncbi:MAG TPA: acetamidase/formamidase family protein, partial [Anaerolineales bacterium]|nr:acetamidase/formamidase family protein [Anaerolineales bacterium]